MIVLKNRFWKVFLAQISNGTWFLAEKQFMSVCVSLMFYRYCKNVLIETLKLILFFLSFSFRSIMPLGVGIAILRVLCLWMLFTLIGSSVGK